MKRSLILGVGALLLAASIFVVNLVWFRPFSVDHFFWRYQVESTLRSPESLTYLGLLDGTPFDWYNAELDEAGPAAEAANLAFNRKMLGLLHDYHWAALAPEQQLSWSILEHQLRMAVTNGDFPQHGFAMTQQDGGYLYLLRLLTSVQPLDRARDVDNYLSRLGKIPRRLGQELASVQHQAEQGVRAPAIIVSKIISNLDHVLALPAAEQTVVTELHSRLQPLVQAGTVTATQVANWVAEAERITSDQVLPSYQALRSWHQDNLAAAPIAVGAWALPDGAAWYRSRIAKMTTLDLDPAQIHDLGLADVARISAEMDPLLQSLGYDQGPVGARMRALSLAPEHQFPETIEGREALLQAFRDIIKEAQTKLPEWVHHVADIPVEVRRVPPYAEETAPAAYYTGPSADGNRPGIFWVNQHDTTSMPRWYLRTLAYHEAIPGHHLESLATSRLHGLPEFRKHAFFVAYSEGWGLYAERLAFESGLHKTTENNLGRLRDELFRAVRLVVDTGLHHHRWTRQRAIDYLADSTGMAMSEVVSEIDRYVVDPGQALGYKIGMNKLLELRQRARDALGDEFKLQDFHAVVLDGGAMPLALLERRVDRWLATAADTGS